MSPLEEEPSKVFAIVAIALEEEDITALSAISFFTVTEIPDVAFAFPALS